MRPDRLFLLLLPALFLAPHATAQVQFGLRAGLNVSNFAGENVGDSSAKLGMLAGAYARYSLTPALYVQPEVLYSQKGASGFTEEEGGAEAIWSADYLDIPLLLGFTAPTGSNLLTRLYAGPQLSVKIGESTEPEGTGPNQDLIKSTDFGIAFGGDVGARRVNRTSEFGVGLRYTIGLTRIVDLEGFADPEFVNDNDVRNRVLSVTAFYTF